jgi:monovalent cation:H+ antiporter, CPA1 family
LSRALIVAVFAARLAVLFLAFPMVNLARLAQPISNAYKLAIAPGGLRGALTLVLALSVTENPALPLPVQRFVAVLATGLVLFTLLVNGTTLRAFIRFLQLDRLSPVDQLLRDRVLETSYGEISESVRKTAQEQNLSPTAEARALAPYQAWKSVAARDSAEEIDLTERERVAVSLVALGNQERMLVLQILASRAASPNAVQTLMRNADALVEGARSSGRIGYKRGGTAAAQCCELLQVLRSIPSAAPSASPCHPSSRRSRRRRNLPDLWCLKLKQAIDRSLYCFRNPRSWV